MVWYPCPWWVQISIKNRSTAERPTFPSECRTRPARRPSGVCSNIDPVSHNWTYNHTSDLYLLSHMPRCISMISGVCVQGIWNAQVKCQQPLWHSFVYRNVWHHNGATIATIVATIATTNSNRLFHQVSSIYLIQTAKLIPNFQMKPDTYFIT